MYKLRMKVGKINCILWNNHLFFQWHRKKHPKCTLESYFEFVLLARHRKCQDKVSQFSIVKGEEKGSKTVEALKTRLTSVQTARRILCTIYTTPSANFALHRLQFSSQRSSCSSDIILSMQRLRKRETSATLGRISWHIPVPSQPRVSHRSWQTPCQSRLQAAAQQRLCQ